MKKITQNLTNLKAWQSTIFAFMFLFSLTINAQVSVAFDASATTDGASATFSFAIDNFVVGNAGDGVDGHIHYSLNGGSDVMIYSSDDLTLSDLPNGNHTIVFSLRDSSHQPLDPAVEQTLEFSTTVITEGCGGSATYTYGDSESSTDILYTYTNPDAGAIEITVTGQTETNYDFLVVTDGAGAELYNASGDHTGQVITSADGVINIAISSDSSYSPGSDGLGNGTEMTFTASCPVSTFDVTFSVNTANITVGENGMYLGGGAYFGGPQGHAMSDEDGDGTWTVTLQFLNHGLDQIIFS